MNKPVYTFEEGDFKQRKLLGGKGAGLCEMTRIGLPVPPGFCITTEVCKSFYKNGKKIEDSVMAEIKKGVEYIEKKTGHKLGDAEDPLLVSVRSGAAMSMPGMMDTILNLGLTSKSVLGLAKQTKNERFAYDAYRRFISLYGHIALDIDDRYFDDVMNGVKAKKGVKQDTELNVDDLKEIVEGYKKVVHEKTGKPFPDDAMEQLDYAVKAVFGSWNGARAVAYRKQFKITEEMADGTACNVVAMVFGNMGEDSGTGVAFTRDPGTGENVFFGEYLTNAQGEDVVAGIRTPKPILEMEKDLPESFKQLCDIRAKLEAHFKEVQDFEFTIEKNKLYMLQTRNGKMNAQATVRSSVEMFESGLITKEQAVLRVKPDMIDQLLHKQIDPKYKESPLAKGLNASPGAAIGACVFDADDAVKLAAEKKVILVREETKPEDIHGFFAAQGVLTSRGGKTSHAAVVARGMGKPCVSGAESIFVDVDKKIAKVGETVLKEGDIITIDGSTGNVFKGEVPLVDPEMTGNFGKILGYADELRRLKVFANCDTPEAAKKAREFGAQGIGLVRTERMFNAVDRLPIVVEMIMAPTLEERKKQLDRLLPLQRSDFVGIFKAMDGLPVTVRLLDPPLHEFLPTLEVVLRELFELKSKNAPAAEIEKKEVVLKKVKELMEVNPMIGHRGVRLGITNPEIYTMQVRALFEAEAECKKAGVKVCLEIMLPNVTDVNELTWMRTHVFTPVKEQVERECGTSIEYMYGSMVECVRAGLTAGELAKEAEFFSFGTNDLTQGTFSYSREDVEQKFMPTYVAEKILPANPFEILDRKGVGKVMSIAVGEARKTRPDIIVGICGEHGGEPSSIEWCHIIGLDYCSCSTFRIPVARLAAAHAAILNK